jgi:Putative zinc-finger
MGMRPVRPLVCERVRGQISVGLDGELSQLERVMIASHLERCAPCQSYEHQVSAVTRMLRTAPLEPIARPVVIHRRRGHFVGTRIQVAAAAAVAVAALVGASEALRGQQLNIEPSFVPEGGAAQMHYMTRQQVEREQAILARARPGHPVQLEGRAL